jgi:transcriptional regulator with XRE-family HTH domain
MNTIDYLDAIRKKLNLPSDYALQRPLGVSKSQLSKYRTGRDYLSDDVAIRVAHILDVNSGKVLLDMHIERSRTPELRAAWVELMEKISLSFTDLLLGSGPRQRLI